MKILLCDDHAVVRDGLRLVLADLGPDVEVLDADRLEAALAAAEAHPDLDLVLMDLQMPGVAGVEGVRRFRAAHPTLPVAVVSASEEAGSMREVLDLGAAGFVPKSLGRDELLAAVRLILSGGVFVPKAALADPGQGEREARARRKQRAAGLTDRQLEVLSLLARGLTNKEICGVLGIAENTVKTHVKAILEALDATNRTEAAVLARELDLKAPGEA